MIRAEREALQPPTAEPDPDNAGAGREPSMTSVHPAPSPTPSHLTAPMRTKLYQRGSRPDLLVPFAQVELSSGNAPVRLYDTSGPGSDPEVGLPALRLGWIVERGDVDTAAAVGSANAGRTVRRARPGQRVTQLHYARRGITTPEMEFAAIRALPARLE